MKKKTIIGICGSASENSGNLSILNYIGNSGFLDFNFKIIDDLTVFPHFQTKLTDNTVPEKIITLRNDILNAAGVIICTPEYVFSIPSGLKNILEWSVSTTIFSEKPIGLITASASGEKAHEELQLIMKTLQTKFNAETTLLIQGVKGKVSHEGEIKNLITKNELDKFILSFAKLIEN